MLELHDQMQEAADAIRKRWDRQPHAGIILGTGLGNLVESIEVEAAFDYDDIPHFPKSTATFHATKPTRASIGPLTMSRSGTSFARWYLLFQARSRRAMEND